MSRTCMCCFLTLFGYLIELQRQACFKAILKKKKKKKVLTYLTVSGIMNEPNVSIIYDFQNVACFLLFSVVCILLVTY